VTAHHIDARGWKCPAPVIELSRAVKESDVEDIIIDVDDPAAAVDIPAWCRMRQHRHNSVERIDAFDRHHITVMR